MTERQLKFDFKTLQERAHTGVRRAAAFLGIAEHFTEETFPRSLTLGRGVKKQFLPDPVPDDVLPEIRRNWRSWITGNALRELDQFLSLLLDDAYDLVQQSKIVANQFPANYQWKRIAERTNVAAKHKLVLEACGCFAAPHLDDQKCLISLSETRNCLSHDLGIVTPKRVDQDQKLSVQWISVQTFVRQGEMIFDLNTVEYPFSLDPEGPDGIVFAQITLMDRHFALGELVQFTPDELLDICFFYLMVIDRVIETIQNFAIRSGVVVTSAQTDTAVPAIS